MKQVRSSSQSTARFLQHDRDFVALVDGAFQDAAQRSGPHLLCRPGCSQCCVGVFPVGPADALRVEHGMDDLARNDPERFARVRARAAESWTRLAPQFPGESASGVLKLEEDGELPEQFEHFANHEVCPVLDPIAGTCDLYQARPHTCRVFGPPVATPEGFGVCELCFQRASPQEIAAAVIAPEPLGSSEALDRDALDAGASSGNTILAFVLSRPPSS